MRKTAIIAIALVVAAIALATIFVRRQPAMPVSQQASSTFQVPPIPTSTANVLPQDLNARSAQVAARIKGFASAFRVSIEPLELISINDDGSAKIRARITDNGAISEKELTTGKVLHFSQADVVMDSATPENSRGSTQPVYLFGFTVTLR